MRQVHFAKLKHACAVGISISVLLLTAGLLRADSGSYPGEIGSGNARVILSLLDVEMGLHAYYKVYGRWPDSWAEVIQVGLWQTQIPSHDGQDIDPDDPNIDFFDDVYYASELSNSEDGKARILIGGTRGSQPIRTILLDPPKTYSQYFMEVDGFVQSNLGATYANDQEMQRLFALLGEVSSISGIFYSIHNRWPQSLEEFLGSGLSPIDANSINPVTGKGFRFDGSAGDVTIEFDAQYGPRLSHTLRDGSSAPYKISYF